MHRGVPFVDTDDLSGLLKDGTMSDLMVPMKQAAVLTKKVYIVQLACVHITYTQ